MAAADVTNSPVHWVEAAVAAGTGLPGQAAIVSLTDNSGGVASDTLADVPAAYNEAALAAHIASLAAKINLIITRLRAVGIIVT